MCHNLQKFIDRNSIIHYDGLLGTFVVGGTGDINLISKVNVSPDMLFWVYVIFCQLLCCNVLKTREK